MAKKKTTLEAIADQIAKMDAPMDRGFSAVADDIADIKHNMASKGQMIALHTQVTSIETDIRSMKHTKLQARVADLEKKSSEQPATKRGSRRYPRRRPVYA